MEKGKLLLLWLALAAVPAMAQTKADSSAAVSTQAVMDRPDVSVSSKHVGAYATNISPSGMSTFSLTAASYPMMISGTRNYRWLNPASVRPASLDQAQPTAQAPAQPQTSEPPSLPFFYAHRQSLN